MYITPNLTIVKKPQLKLGMLGIDQSDEIMFSELPNMYLERDMRTKDRSEDYIAPVDYTQNTEYLPLCETTDGKYWAIDMHGELVKVSGL